LECGEEDRQRRKKDNKRNKTTVVRGDLHSVWKKKFFSERECDKGGIISREDSHATNKKD